MPFPKLPASMALCAALAACAAIPSSQAAGPASLAVTVKQANGLPVRDAVVMVYPKSAGASGPIRFGWKYDMAQANISFTPGTLIVPAGATVRFPNHDKVRHSIYSFSKAAKIDIQLYGRDETRTHAFAVPGSVSLGCKIHDKMRGYIKVVDTPYAAKTDHNGLVRLAQLPGGAATIKVWHPGLRSRTGEHLEAVTLTAGQAMSRPISVELRPLK
ncbi:carboxypeptidase regulatory-like domain-containing protein [Blastomonas sp.]|uniref:carboxypeptidase regulatory-like domain-containing protein n=1 Tax=Blastomonas sp. TaxID=1909299 RepID=UPI00262F363A|nr:carboxypeptidase regulatory-like domain-containing protein [Blastomonas sp.]MDM7954799.1 carboxypeptidase regulatory-like domain-containing protein [Blastomonas sp.]